MTTRAAAQRRLTASEIDARVRLLLEHHHRASRSMLADFCNLSLHDFDAALTANRDLREHVQAMRTASKPDHYCLDFEYNYLAARAVMEIERLGGPDSGWTPNMHPDYRHAP